MPGFLLHEGAIVTCVHGGDAEPVSANPRVQVTDLPVVTQTCTYVVEGCAFPPPPTANGPCVTGMWAVAATRIFIEGVPVLLNVGEAVCAPTGTPLIVEEVQTRVMGV